MSPYVSSSNAFVLKIFHGTAGLGLLSVGSGDTGHEEHFTISAGLNSSSTDVVEGAKH
jgi:hypothetical protein